MYVFHCTACNTDGHFESFADANRFEGWTHIGESLICGDCYLKRLAAKRPKIPEPFDVSRPTPEDLVSGDDCPRCGCSAFRNPDECPRCAEEWQNAAELARNHH